MFKEELSKNKRTIGHERHEPGTPSQSATTWPSTPSQTSEHDHLPTIAPRLDDGAMSGGHSRRLTRRCIICSQSRACGRGTKCHRWCFPTASCRLMRVGPERDRRDGLDVRGHRRGEAARGAVHPLERDGRVRPLAVSSISRLAVDAVVGVDSLYTCNGVVADNNGAGRLLAGAAAGAGASSRDFVNSWSQYGTYNFDMETPPCATASRRGSAPHPSRPA